MKVVRDQLRRDDVEHVVNACDAGREGELIFTYIYEYVKAKKPVQRLWLNSMTNQAMREAFGHLRDGADLGALRDAAKSRSEADWIVGMNATRAATIRLRSSFDGAVSLGRVQTPTLAIIARREEEIRAFKPEKYWLVDAAFEADGARRYEGRFHAGAQPRLKSAAEAAGDRRRRARRARRDHQARQDQAQGAPAAAVRPHVAAARGQHALRLQRAPHARRRAALLRGAQGADLSAHQLALPDQRHGPRVQADRRARSAGAPSTARRRAYVQSLDLLPLGRVVDDAKVGDHHAIIPTNSEHDLEKMNDDDRRVYDLVARRFLAVFHPEAEFENTRVETTVAAHIFRTRGKVLLVPGWRGVYGELSEGDGAAGDDDEGRDQQLPRLERGEAVDTREAESLEKETKPPRRYSDASLLGAMETAGKLVDDEEMREAMKESGIGTPATRAAIIERLIDVGYVERDGRALVATEKGMNVVRLLGEHPLTSPALTGDWEHRLAAIEAGDERREKFMEDIAKFAGETVGVLDTTLKDVRIPRANLGPCPVCGNDIVENRKGYSCWSREDPGCGFVIWKSKAGKQLPAAAARELIAHGFTARPVTGFKGRSGRSFRAKLALEQSADEDARWRVEFDEPWAKEGAKPPEAAERDGRRRRGPMRARRPRSALAARVGARAGAARARRRERDRQAGSATASAGAVQATLTLGGGRVRQQGPAPDRHPRRRAGLRRLAHSRAAAPAPRTAASTPPRASATRRCRSSISTPTASPRSSSTPTPAARTAAR